MNRKTLIVLLVLIVAVSVFVAACGGDDETTTTTAAAGGETTTTEAASGEPIKFGFDAGFTGFMAYDVQLAEKGILTALDMLGNQVAGRPLEMVKADNASDPVVAVDKARQLVESDGISLMVGPIFSPATAAVTDYLGKSGGIPQISIVGQPTENLATANKLAFMPTGFFDAHGYYFGKYAAEELGYKTVNAIHYEDTASRGLQAGFEKGFTEGGGEVLSVNYVPIDSVDFSAYLTTMKPADATLFWVFGNGAVPFVKQYNDYGLTAPLLVPMSNNFSDEQLAELGDIGVGMVACDYYAYTVDYPLNQEFVDAFQKLYPGENPTPQALGGWQAVMLFAEALDATGGDTTPAAIIDALANISVDTPAGKVTMSPFQDAYAGTRDFFMLETQKVGDVITWVPKYTYEQVLLAY